MDCATKYPVLLLHGFGFRDEIPFRYWGRIPDALRDEGIKVYDGLGDATASPYDNAAMISNRIDQILRDTGAEKVNIIGHSKGGLDARCIASQYDKNAERIASVTLMATPNNGSKTLDFIANHVPENVIKAVVKPIGLVYRLLGDKHEDTFNSIMLFTTKGADRFNADNKDVDGIYYQSYAGCMSRMYSDPILCWTYPMVFLIEGSNDGLMTPKNAKWGDFKGVVKAPTFRGVSHSDLTDCHARPYTSKQKEGCVSDPVVFYKEIMADLKSRGF